MKVVLDTNVVMSALFFGGVPGRILDAWNARQISLVLSAPVLAEYREVGVELSAAASGSEVIVSGDQKLLATSGWRGIDVVTPRQFVERHLRDS